MKQNNISKRLVCMATALVLSAGIIHAQEETLKNCVDYQSKTNIETIRKYLEVIPEGHETSYGFNSRDEFSRVEMGQPMRIQLLETDQVLSGNPDRAIVETNNWYLPIYVGESSPCLLYLTETNDGCKLVGLGLKLMAKNVNRIRRELQIGKEETTKLLVDNNIEFAAFVVQERGIARYTTVRVINGRANTAGRSFSRKELLNQLTLNQKRHNINQVNH